MQKELNQISRVSSNNLRDEKHSLSQNCLLVFFTSDCSCRISCAIIARKLPLSLAYCDPSNEYTAFGTVAHVRHVCLRFSACHFGTHTHALDYDCTTMILAHFEITKIIIKPHNFGIIIIIIIYYILLLKRFARSFPTP